ncbi:MAG: DUF3465 domain-containing protein [Candidatus Obscuribacterales bacterium]|nr:DUF3465 domain-containing protein [Candidatus Obscuribacterales bacterium]
MKINTVTQSASLAILCLLLPFLSGCNSSTSSLTDVNAKQKRVLSYEDEPGYEAAFGKPNDVPDTGENLTGYQQEIIQAQTQHLRKVEVLVNAQVCRLLPTDNNGLRHQKFLIRLTNGTTVLVANDITMGQEVPCNEGDILEIKGEYIWTRRGGVLHWTHHSDTNEHPGGWIRLGSQTYQ